MEIVDAVDDERVVIDQRNLKPFRSESTPALALDASGDGTAVTWSMTGPVTHMTRIIGIFKSMDRMVGPLFEKGSGEAQGRRRGRVTSRKPVINR